MLRASATALVAATAGARVQRTVACETEPSHWAPFKHAFRGQVTPRRAMPHHQCVGESAVELQLGPFGSRWIRVRRGGEALRTILERVDEAERLTQAAVWVGVPDDHPEASALISDLRRRGFRYHHAMDGKHAEQPANELFYYRWLGEGEDMVPDYTTAHEGVGALVLSPDKTEVLLVWEYGHWKMITGNLEGCDSVVETMKREVLEECGISLNDDAQVVGGWQDAQAYDAVGNNVFTIFVASAKHLNIQVDGKEIQRARWFPLHSLPSVGDVDSATIDPKMPYGVVWDTGDNERNLISRVVPRYLSTWAEGRSLHVDVSGRRTSFL